MTKKILKYSSVLLLLASVAISSCKKLDEINHDPTKPTTADPQYLLTGAQKSTMDVLYSGLQNGYIAMHYAQFWSGNSRTNDSQYQLDEGNNATLWNNLYRISLHNLDDLVKQNNAKINEPGKANQNAIAKITSAWIYQILADTYGNIPYSQAFQSTTNITPKYDDAQTIYNSLLDTLQAQINVLDTAQTSFNAGDIIYNGNVLKWKKLAHSLMLRMAIRMSDANPTKAKQIIEAHYKDAISSNLENAQLLYLNAAPNKFPLNDTEREIADFFVSTTLVDYMKSVNDPRLGIYARPSHDDDTIKGMPYGLAASDKGRLSQTHYSYPGKQIYSATMPGILMGYPEVEFILAEAAARGMNVGDAATHYTNGIKASINYWRLLTSNTNITDAGIQTYIAGVPYVAADWRNVIGTQKWLALYPQGFQAWFERTRLKFNKPGGAPLFITPVSGSLDASVKMVPFRLTYLQSEQTQNTASYNAAAAAIGGDTKGTMLWYNKF
ncbi:SusD-like starch-binding protein associating with outer membrane [Chitinophaga niastensis]|uniref:SusD-like starch-binding protein associating with outer membrane n=1 Tax=Chitinophaga niastensis TaxID=536980 RepID=A0A2P8HU10_CHINA|nr:SusD/RagB family nutrient-binding outer membrane lipoprotein [Chitinophaga niastensis]PSL49711.1 SusD-like starch-binding protein associating with outer membrane [Chitinophaga niastensis]